MPAIPHRLTILLGCLALGCAPAALAAPLTGLDGLASLLESAPAGSWVHANTNSYQDAWTPEALRAGAGTSYAWPGAIINAWSSFAWDTDRHQMILYGGGHANYMGNDVYTWQAASQHWVRASLPSQVTYMWPNMIPVDGAMNAPQAAHTYDNSVYLPVSRRFLTFGGAAYDSGGAYQIGGYGSDRTGPYMFDPSKADPNKVGGTTGSGVNPATPGGQMWSNRNTAMAPGAPTNFVAGTTANTVEGGKDVIYVSANTGGGSAKDLYRYVINDLANPAADTWEKVGLSWYGASAQGAGAYDPGRRVYLRTSSEASDFTLWNLNFAGPANRDIRINITSKPADFVMSHMWGMDYDPLRDRYLLWDGGGDVYSLGIGSIEDIDGDGLITDWTLSKLALTDMSVIPGPPLGTGTLGKWKYASDLDVFVGLTDPTNGDVWLYKPLAWVDPFAAVEPPPPVPGSLPEPGTLALMLAGMLFLARVRYGA